jgi:rubrerythrin
MASKPEKKNVVSWKCGKCGHVVVNPAKPPKCPNCSGCGSMSGPYSQTLSNIEDNG